MSPPPTRRAGLLDRAVQQRDARLFLVASEDTHAVRQYFAALESNGVVDVRRVRVVVLDTGDSGHSDPAAVRQRLADVERDLDELRPMDERWLCLDVDHWATGRHTPNLARACKEALEVGYQLAVSNPAFEVWLLLHFGEEPESTQAACEARIRALTGSYDKTRLRPERYTAPAVTQAIERARALDVDPTQRWPQAPGTHVYRLVERLPRRA
ncbi:MAG: RloB domain-containing protein [Myxococcales bacterium]|nr:RloB domain-containing protein [Myxococcales bacterium]